MSKRQIFEQIVDEIQNDPIPQKHMEQARQRTLERMIPKPSATALEAMGVKSIKGCEDFQKLIPAFAKKELSEAKMALVGDHTRSCVPCRRFLQEVREQKNLSSSNKKPRTLQKPRGRLVWQVAAAVILFSLVGLGYKTLTSYQWFSPQADISIVDGQLYSLSNQQLVLQDESSVLSYGKDFRAPKDQNAMLKLPDGTQLEVAPRSIFNLEKSGKGTTLNLLAGKAIIEAAKQHDDNRFFVETPDCKVTVKGTVFSVNSGPKGSRVSVFEGEVQVQKGKTTSVLLPGNQFTSEVNLKPVPLKREVSWTMAPSRLQPFLDSLSAATERFETNLAEEGTRYQSQLLDYMPDGTCVYGAFPNIGQSALEIFETVKTKLEQYPEIKKALTQNNIDGIDTDLSDAIHIFGELSSYFGSEIAFGVNCKKDVPPTVLFLAEASGKQGLQDFILNELSKLEIDGDERPEEHMVFITDPADAVQAPETLYIWVIDNYVAASPTLDLLSQLKSDLTQGQNPDFTGTEFYQTLRGLYETGVSVVIGVDISEMVLKSNHIDQLDDSGLADIDDFILVKHEAILDSSFEATLTFKDVRHGIAAWPAEPSPLESLNFISPDVTAFASVALIDPEFMLSDLIKTMRNNTNVQDLMSQEEDAIFGLIHDLAVALGGEITVAIDGPILPIPHWKVIAELYDGELLNESVDQIIALSNQSNDLAIERISTVFNGYSVNEVRSGKFGWHFYYTVIDGYFIAVPNLSLLDQTLKNLEFNLSILTSEEFSKLLPSNSYNEFSFLFYQNLSQIFESASQLMPNTKPEDVQRMQTIQAAMAPKLIYGYAEEQRISIASTGGESILNLILMQILQPQNANLDLLEKMFEIPDVH